MAEYSMPTLELVGSLREVTLDREHGHRAHRRDWTFSG
jgi:hypothetical protein